MGITPTITALTIYDMKVTLVLLLSLSAVVFSQRNFSPPNPDTKPTATPPPPPKNIPQKSFTTFAARRPCAWVFVWRNGWVYLCDDQCPAVHEGWSSETPRWCYGDYQDYLDGDCKWIWYNFTWKCVKKCCCPGAFPRVG